MSINRQIAQELSIKEQQVDAVTTLIDDGATIPFIARYRKEATGGLDDQQLRLLEQKLHKLTDLYERRQSILKSIQAQGKLSLQIQQALEQAETKTQLEDIYLPYKPKRRNKALIAKEAGLQPLAEKLLAQHQCSPELEAQNFIKPQANINSVEDALEGAKSIIIEQFSEDANLLNQLRKLCLTKAHLCSKVIKNKQSKAATYKDYFEHSELLKKVPSHRALAMLRGRNEGYLKLSLDLSPELETKPTSGPAERLIAEYCHCDISATNKENWLFLLICNAWKQKLSKQIETELLSELREKAEQASIDIFATNLKDLLMAAPAGKHNTLGLDPGLRTGVKLAVIDDTGKVLHTACIFPHPPQSAWDKSLRSLEQICRQYKVSLLSIGNGTGSRETDKLAAELIKSTPDLSLKKVVVSEAGASVYSASELASKEFPNIDVSLRGAISIARRLQDPLAELVKIDPKAIGVGQYQHDVNQSQLAMRLSAVVEDCVNAVGVDVNRASPALLSYVSGLSKSISQNIVTYREQYGAFSNRKQLLKVARLGPKAFEQSAGFLRILGGDNPLDASAVHPEAYHLAQHILNKANTDVNEVIGKENALEQVQAKDFITEQFGLPTIEDVMQELVKPGRDPRPEFKTANFKEGIETINDLKIGMTLEGVISNVANFGAFVDLGVHQDGLIHISALSHGFVDDPHKLVKAGDIVTVKVIDLDIGRKRINLSMRLNDKIQNNKESNKTNNKIKPNKIKQGASKKASKQAPVINSAFADAFAKAKKK